MLSGVLAAEPVCPPGSYLNRTTRRLRNAELRAWHRLKVEADGWAPLPWVQPHAKADVRSRFSTYCSADFPKPPQCRSDPWATRDDYIPHQIFPSGRAGAPVRYVWHRVEFVHNYKVAGSSLMRYLACEYGEERSDANGRVSVVAVRDPIDRFVSAVTEVLHRVLNGVCPGGPCPPIETAGMLRSTAWYPIARQLLAPGALPALMAAFASDLACCHAFYASDHLQPQVAFAANHLERGLDVVLRVGALGKGLGALARRAGDHATDDADGASTGRQRPSSSSGKRCELPQANDASSKPLNVPSASALRRALFTNATAVRQLCDVLAHDYVCFGFALPAVCRPSAVGAANQPVAVASEPQATARAPSQPLVSAVVVLRACPRGGAIATAAVVGAVGALALQTFPRELMELLVVVADAATAAEIDEDAVRHAAAAAAVAVRYVHAPQRGPGAAAASGVGALRNAAVRAARGEVVMHVDDGGMGEVGGAEAAVVWHHPSRVAAQAGPLLRGEASLTALTYSWAVKLRGGDEGGEGGEGGGGGSEGGGGGGGGGGGQAASAELAWSRAREPPAAALSTMAYLRKLALAQPFAEPELEATKGAAARPRRRSWRGRGRASRPRPR